MAGTDDVEGAETSPGDIRLRWPRCLPTLQKGLAQSGDARSWDPWAFLPRTQPSRQRYLLLSRTALNTHQASNDFAVRLRMMYAFSPNM